MTEPSSKAKTLPRRLPPLSDPRKQPRSELVQEGLGPRVPCSQASKVAELGSTGALTHGRECDGHQATRCSVTDPLVGTVALRRPGDSCVLGAGESARDASHPRTP